MHSSQWCMVVVQSPMISQDYLLAPCVCVLQVFSAAREFKTPDAQQIPSRSADAQCFLLVLLGMDVGMDQTYTNPSYSGVNRRAVLTHSHSGSTCSLSWRKSCPLSKDKPPTQTTSRCLLQPACFPHVFMIRWLRRICIFWVIRLGNKHRPWKSPIFNGN